MTGVDAEDPLYGPLTDLAAEMAGETLRRVRWEQAAPDTDQLTLPADLDDDGDDDLEDEEFDPAAVRQRRPRPRSRHSGQNEAGLARDALNELNRRAGVFARKTVGSAAGGAGEPDLDICAATGGGIGRAVKIELKVGSAKPEPVQTRRLLQWQEAGALVGWATSIEQIDQILAHLDDPGYEWTPDAGAGAPVPD